MRYTPISELYRQVRERKLTPQEIEDREKIAKKLPMDDFKKRYGKDAMAVKMATATNIVKKKSAKSEVKEDGHTDVASAIRQCKTVTEDAMQILQKLKSMSPEDSLPSWWTNKLAVASNSMNKLRDYFLVPSVSEEVELDEKAGDIPDLQKLIGELQNASKMHLAQSKRVQAHVDMMTRANAKGPEGAGGLQDLKKIVGELEKASQAHLRQSKSIDAHVDFMGESLDEAMKYNFMVLDRDGRVMGMTSSEKDAERQAKGDNIRGQTGRVVKLRRPMSTTRGDRLIGMLPADNLGEEMINEQPEHEITVGNYTTKHFYMCGSAQTTMKKHADKEGAEELTRMQDMFYKMEKDAMDAGGANEEQKKKSQILYDKIMAKAKEVGIADEVDKYMKMHLDSMLKNDPKLGFGRTDLKESYQEMIARIMSQRSMR